MWAAINEENRECTIFAERRDALIYVAGLERYRYELPERPCKMDTGALAAFVNEQEEDDKAWIVVQAVMGKPIVEEVEEEEGGGGRT